MNASPLLKRVLAPSIPYATIGIGLLVFHNAWLAIVGYHAGMIAVIRLSPAGIAANPSYRGHGYSIPLVAALAGSCAGLLLYIVWPSLGFTHDPGSYVRIIGLNDQTWPAFLAYFILTNALIEEYYWRGYLAPVGKGIGLNDLMFSGYHLIVLAGLLEPVWLMVVFVCLAAGAWFWRQLNRLNGGLLASTVSHLTADATVILTVYYMSMK
jgi:hypothetical protein